GCTEMSNTLLVFEFCEVFPAGGGVCTGGTCTLPQDCPPGTDISFDILGGPLCSTTSFQNTSPELILNTQSWDFGDGTTSTDLNPTHTYAQAGFYVVIFQGISHATGDLCWEAEVNTVPVAADFIMADACAGSPAEFRDESTFIPTTSIAGWDWNFGDPASGAANTSTDQHPMHTYAASGTYTVSLTVTDQSGCTSTKVEQVEIFALPSVDFAQPADNCEASGMEFIANVSADVVKYEWDFDDPTSGPANTATEPMTFHVFESAGVYDVMLTVTSVYGCTESFALAVTVEPNSLSGAISASGPLTICAGDDVDLTAPPGGISWTWSNGFITETITVFEEDSYSVTITDGDGCEYTPAPVVLDVVPLPTANIAAVEYNEYGQAVNFFYNTYSVCEGEDVNLIVPDNANYFYVWENGETGNETTYAEWHGNPLAVGSHTIELDITDQSTGCQNTESFVVDVHPVPANVLIVSSMLPICEGDVATLSVDNPVTGFTYVWNTGEVATSIDVFVAGEYYVRAINQFGCSAESNRIAVSAAPDISRIPSGCHTRCKPDTICLPGMPTVVSYQWYLDGTPIPGPEGNVANYVALESGVYHVEMVDLLGCTSTSDVLTLDLYDGFGTIAGNVYYDVNENGIIDGPDTLVSGVVIQLQDGAATVLGTTTSDVSGAYTFANILSTDYTLVVDTNSLPLYTTIINVEEAASLFGCDDVEELNWLLIEDCPEISTSLAFNACEGEAIMYEGNAVMAGTSEDFTFEAFAGCDSIVTVTVAPIDKDTVDLSFETCSGTTISYNGDQLQPGTVSEYMFMNEAGCDSLVIVTVDELFEDSENVNLVACEGSSVIYDGTELFAGTTTEFNFTNESGCDSVVTVTVQELTSTLTFLDFEVCPYEEVQYLNTVLYPGDTESFTLLDQYGCDSIVQVSVAAYAEVEFSLAGDPVCWNEVIGAIAVENLSGGTAPYLYAIDGGPFKASPDLENLQGGTHIIQVQDDNGCIYEQSYTLETIERIELELEADLLLCEGPAVTIAPILLSSGSGDITYTWPDGSTGFFYEVDEPGTYYVDASNVCESLRVEVEVNREVDPQKDFIYMPNAFSPDFDGVNDEFRGFVADGVQMVSFEMMVFDRWGNQLFQTKDVADGWDGVFRSERMGTGVYVYYIDAVVESCGRLVEVFKKGDVTLIR
ncbi:MAG: PKD domain-containing protein, partial [Phaeodactylibacter sp.]|nr:PKD domain-containing protein [Phaeodactylibacter sp.]